MKKFIIDLLERALKTAAQSAIAAIGTSTFIEGANWFHVLSVVAMSTLLSVLTSIASHNFGEKGTASLTNCKSTAETVAEIEKSGEDAE